jgi:hypothetical protein
MAGAGGVTGVTAGGAGAGSGGTLDAMRWARTSNAGLSEPAMSAVMTGQRDGASSPAAQLAVSEAPESLRVMPSWLDSWFIEAWVRA